VGSDGNIAVTHFVAGGGGGGDGRNHDTAWQGRPDIGSQRRGVSFNPRNEGSKGVSIT